MIVGVVFCRMNWYWKIGDSLPVPLAPVYDTHDTNRLVPKAYGPAKPWLEFRALTTVAACTVPKVGKALVLTANRNEATDESPTNDSVAAPVAPNTADTAIMPTSCAGIVTGSESETRPVADTVNVTWPLGCPDNGRVATKSA